MFTTWLGRLLKTDDDGTPVGINVTVGAVVIVAAAFLAAHVPVAEGQWRCAVVAAAVGLFAAFTVDPRAVAAVLVPTWLIMNGFLVNRLGDLSWHGTADVDRFLVLTAAAVVGLAIGVTSRQLDGARRRWQLGAVVQAMNPEINKETRRRA